MPGGKVPGGRVPEGRGETTEVGLRERLLQFITRTQLPVIVSCRRLLIG